MPQRVQPSYACRRRSVNACLRLGLEQAASAAAYILAGGRRSP